jgi:hypothetical protein
MREEQLEEVAQLTERQNVHTETREPLLTKRAREHKQVSYQHKRA